MAMNQNIGTHGVAASSGYQVLSGLTNPVFVEIFQERFTADSIVGMITDSSVFPSELRTSGDLAIIPKAPRGEIFSYTKNQVLQASHLNSGSITLKIDKAWYWNLKIDDVDAKQIKNIGKWIVAFQENSMRDHAMIQENLILAEMADSAHICNKGARAGARSHSYDLGQAGAPLDLTSSGAKNPLTLTAVIKAVLGEQFVPAGKMFIVWPLVVEPLFAATPILASAYMSGEARSTLLTGSIPKVMGFDHFFSAASPSYTDTSAGNPLCYAVVFGAKTATGYVMQMNESQIIKENASHFGQFWRGLLIAGWGVIRPEALGVAYVKVTNIY
jgi:hypothetical protein